ncbi:MAG: branched-chain amino acid ABC transporter permease [Hyphomicrobiales bacterium]|nr:branched-chain amino acid ABC transporter permease [Hyphomicrobiales bacterium]
MSDTPLQADRDKAFAFLKAQARWRWPEIALWAFAFASILLMPSRALLINEIAILALFALSLDLILGYAGIVSLGHGAFFGVGAYTAGLLAKAGAGAAPLSDPTLGLLAAGATAAMIGYATSFLVLRGNDLTKLMVTLGIALIFQELANKFSDITGGADGLQGVTPAKVLGLFDFDIYGKTAAFYSVTVLFLLFCAARVIVHSPFGISLRAIKGNALRARAIGVPVDARLRAIYTLAAAYAGVAGALLAQTTAQVSLDVLEFHRSADTLLIVVLGGVGTLYGAVVGAAAFKMMYDFISSYTQQYWQFWLGLILVVLVLFVRGGIMGLIARLTGQEERA